MSRLLVLTTPELAVGYRLAGAATLAVASPEEASSRLEELLRSEQGVIALHEPYFHALDRALRARLDVLRAPLVVPLPAGASAEGASNRQDRLLKMLWQAVGYQITFDGEGTRT